MGKLGETIREQRKKLKIKVYELAKQANVHPTYITYIEKHNRLPSLEIIDKLEKILDIRLKLAYFEAKHPSLSTEEYSDAVSTLDDGSSVDTKSPRYILTTELGHFLARPKKERDPIATATKCLTMISPDLKDNGKLTKTFVDKILTLQKAYDNYKMTETATVRLLCKSLPAGKTKRLLSPQI